MIEDLKESTLYALKQRLMDPFLGLFTLALVLYNWQPLAILIAGELPMVDEIAYVQSRFFGTPCAVASCVLHPLVFSLLWFLIWPWIRRAVVYYHSWQLLSLAKARKDLADQPRFGASIEVLRRDQEKLRFVESFLLNTFREQLPLETGPVVLSYCPLAEIGSWVDYGGTTSKLAFASKKSPVHASGVVVATIGGGYVLIQQSGKVSWKIFEEKCKQPSGSISFYLTENPGIMSPQQPAFPAVQVLGVSELTDTGAVLSIKLEVKR